MALDMRGAVLPEEPAWNSSPSSPEGMLGRLPDDSDVWLPAGVAAMCSDNRLNTVL